MLLERTAAHQPCGPFPTSPTPLLFGPRGTPCVLLPIQRMAYSCPDRKGLSTQTYVWKERQRIQAPKERMWVTIGKASDSLEPCILAHFVPDSVALGKPLHLFVPQFPLLYQERLLIDNWGPSIPLVSRFADQPPGGAASSGSGCYRRVRPSFQALDSNTLAAWQARLSEERFAAAKAPSTLVPSKRLAAPLVDMMTTPFPWSLSLVLVSSLPSPLSFTGTGWGARRDRFGFTAAPDSAWCGLGELVPRWR